MLIVEALKKSFMELRPRQKKNLDEDTAVTSSSSSSIATPESKLRDLITKKQNERKSKKLKMKEVNPIKTNEDPTNNNNSHDFDSMVTVLDAEPVDPTPDTSLAGMAVEALLNCLEIANSYLRANRQLIIDDFQRFYRLKRSVDFRSAGPADMEHQFMQVETAQRMSVHAVHLGLLGRYKAQSEEDKQFFEKFLDDSKIVESESSCYFVEQLGPPLMGAVGYGGTRISIAFSPLAPTRNDFWCVFLTNRCIKYLSAMLEERGYKIFIEKRASPDKKGFYALWTIDWTQSPSPPPASPAAPEPSSMSTESSHEKDPSEAPRGAGSDDDSRVST